MTQLVLVSSCGAALLTVALAGWMYEISQQSQHRNSRLLVQGDLARLEVQTDSLLTLGDLVFFSHQQDYLLPAMTAQLDQYVHTMDRLATHTKKVLPERSEAWHAFQASNTRLRAIIQKRAAASERLEIERLTAEYEEAAERLVNTLVTTERDVEHWGRLLDASHHRQLNNGFILLLLLLLVYLLSMINVWRRVHHLVAIPIRRIERSAQEALERGSPYTHETIGATEIIDVSRQLQSLIGHLERQIAQRTESLATQTRQLQHEVAERFEKDKQLQKKNADLRKAMRDLAAAQRELIKRARLRALGEMAGGVAHDFNNALTPILASVDFLLGGLSTLEEEEIAESLRLIRMAGMDAAGLVQRLRSHYVGKNDTLYGPIDLETLVSETIKLTERDWRRPVDAEGRPAIEVRTNVTSGLLAWGNSTQIRQALVNLLVNAVHASPDGGVITLRAEPGDGGPFLQISDQGCGMSPEVLQRCREPLFTTKGERGTGLGLANVCNMVEEHGGRLEIESEVGVGSTVTIYLLSASWRTDMELLDAWAEHEGRREMALKTSFDHGSGAPDCSEEKSESEYAPIVLVVDDDRMVGRVVERIVKRAGYRVSVVCSPLDAVRWCEENSPDILITDYNMPVMTGGTLALNVREQHPLVPIILMSGRRGEAQAELLQNGTVDHIISKPLQITELFDRIEQCLNRGASVAAP